MLRILWLGFIICGFSCVLAQSQTQFADAVLIHGHIYTVDANHPWAEALAIRDGKILAVGSDRDIAQSDADYRRVFEISS